MEKKQRLFIYDRKELGVLILLGVMVAVFAFTLGVHLGKHVQARTDSDAHPVTPTVETAPDTVPNRQELSEQSKNIGESADQALEKATEEEAIDSGVALDVPKPVELPKNTVSKKDGATSLSEDQHETKSENKPESDHASDDQSAVPARKVEEKSAANSESADDELKSPDHPAARRAAPDARYTLQVGSYQSLKEAGQKIARMEKQGIKPYLRSVILKGKGRWYRVYVGGYDSKEAADRAGRQLRKRNLIESYIVSNRFE